jgi:ssDNA-binding Zn-finger/Zn-ribbon topoisomerase 1
LASEMTDEKELTTVITHLTAEEANRVKGILDSLQIPFIASGHDAASRYRSLYYQIKVEYRYFKAAKQVIAKHKAKVFIDSKNCPNCKSLGYKEIEKRGLWKKLYYAGTTLVQCNKCKHEFGI